MRPTLALTLATALLATLLGSGCATPQPVKDTSVQTASMMRQLSAEMETYKTAVQVGDADISTTVSTLRKGDEVGRKWLNERVRFDEAGGNAKRVELFLRMKELSNSLLEDDEALRTAQAKIEAEMAALMKPLPDVGPKLTSAADAVLTLGQDRSAQTQFDEALAAWKAVAATTKDNRDKLKKAATP